MKTRTYLVSFGIAIILAVLWGISNTYRPAESAVMQKVIAPKTPPAVPTESRIEALLRQPIIESEAPLTTEPIETPVVEHVDRMTTPQAQIEKIDSEHSKMVHEVFRQLAETDLVTAINMAVDRGKELGDYSCVAVVVSKMDEDAQNTMYTDLTAKGENEVAKYVALAISSTRTIKLASIPDSHPNFRELAAPAMLDGLKRNPSAVWQTVMKKQGPARRGLLEIIAGTEGPNIDTRWASMAKATIENEGKQGVK